MFEQLTLEERAELDKIGTYEERKVFFMNTILPRYYELGFGCDAFDTYTAKRCQYERYELEKRKTVLPPRPHRAKWNHGRKRAPTKLEIWLGL